MMKQLVGRKFNDVETQNEIKKCPFECVEQPNGGVGIKVQYNDEDTIISAEHFMGMMLTRAVAIASSANKGANVADSVLCCPPHFNDHQRKGILHACSIASLNCLRVCNENSAIALNYGIFKNAKGQFSETEKTVVMFIDMGYSTYTVSIVEYFKDNQNVLSAVSVPIGGRDYDNKIIEFLVSEFKSKTKIDVSENKKAILKLQVAAEKAKKFLSPAGVTEAAVNVECLAEDRDLSCTLTKEYFEEITQALNDQLAAPVNQCLEEAGVDLANLSEVEIVGGGSRV
jgi:molecular chaperone DnaK (HSP70)